MSLKLNSCRIVQSKEFPILTGSTVAQEGVCLSAAFENGQEKVKPYAGPTTVAVVGFSYGQAATPATKSLVEVLVVDNGKVTLHAAPLAGQLLIKNAAGTALTAGTPATEAGHYSISGSVITVNTALEDAKVTICYRYSPTVDETMFSDTGVATASFSASDFVSSVGVIQQGEVYTDQFDAASDFATASSIYVTSGGIITATASGNKDITANCTVCHVPDINNPFLGLRVRFA